MEFSLNTEQAKGLANFFFDLAKGLILGGLGLATTVPLETKLFAVIISSFFAVWCVKTALFLLEDIQ